jgi:uncharacterized protein DUF5655
MEVGAHFERADDNVRAVYQRLLATIRANGPFSEDVKKTSIHLVRRIAFAGVVVRRSWIVLTVKSRADIAHPRIIRHEQVSAHRWHLEVRLDTPAQVDRQLASWLRSAYEMAGPVERTNARQHARGCEPLVSPGGRHS